MAETSNSFISEMVLILTATSLASFPAYAKYGGGTGEPDHPYLIYTAEQMDALGAEPQDWDKHFRLMADIDLSAFDGKQGRPVFHIIGTGYYNAFTGVFDGLGHTVSNFTFQDGEAHGVGLFGFIGSHSHVRNLVVQDANVEGRIYVGPLIGYSNGGSVRNCRATGFVRASQYAGGLIGIGTGTLTQCCHANSHVWGTTGPTGGLAGANSGSMILQCSAGGLVEGQAETGGIAGRQDGNSLIQDSYSLCSVSGMAQTTAGIVGWNRDSLVSHCYSAGPVVSGDMAGGLVAVSMGGRTEASFWDIETSGQITSAGGTGSTTAAMHITKTFLDAGWDFMDETANGVEDIWWIDEGKDYPRLWWEAGAPAAPVRYAGGTGEPNDPYQITTAAHLIILGARRLDYDKHFVLTADIDLDPNLPGGRIFDKAVIAPDTDPTRANIQGTPFAGVFDGNGHTISHLTIAGEAYLGLFGWLTSGAEVRCLGVVDVNIAGSGGDIGGLVGANGEYHVGGGAITACYSSGSVCGTVRVGGLAGFNYMGAVTQCYSTAAIEGGRSVGGLVGRNGSGSGGGFPPTISECYSAGYVSGVSDVGGLIGLDQNQCGPVTSSFWDIQTSGQTASYGGTGKTTTEMQVAKTFLDAGWDFVGETDNGTENIWWINEGKDYPRLWWERGDEALP